MSSGSCEALRYGQRRQRVGADERDAAPAGVAQYPVEAFHGTPFARWCFEAVVPLPGAEQPSVLRSDGSAEVPGEGFRDEAGYGWARAAAGQPVGDRGAVVVTRGSLGGAERVDLACQVGRGPAGLGQEEAQGLIRCPG
jgi:hypothetical protein